MDHKIIIGLDIATIVGAEYDALSVFRVTKGNIELLASKSFPTDDVSPEERQMRFNQMVDEVALAYNASDFLKDGSFPKESEFEKQKRKTKTIELLIRQMERRNVIQIHSSNLRADVTDIVRAVVDEEPYLTSDWERAVYLSHQTLDNVKKEFIAKDFERIKKGD